MARETQLTSLGEHTAIVADTGDISAFRAHKVTDATTNPSLLLAAARLEEYQNVVVESIEEAKNNGENSLDDVMDRLAVNVGLMILDLIPGVVSTEIDARLSFDTDAMITRARRVISLYDSKGIAKERILIKLASTWEGIQAAKVLEREGIHCNMTLLFCLAQAVQAAHAKATLISPFVGRITDWHKKAKGVDGFEPEEDPGVLSVRRIYNYYKQHNHLTIVMGASFRNKGQILALAGCDKLTIAPKWLQDMSNTEGAVERKLDPKECAPMEELRFTENEFRWAINEDACATEKLAEGIRKFAADSIKLENLLKEKMKL